MKSVIGIVIFVPLAVLVGVFAVENRTSVSLEFWPLSGAFEMWASLWVLVPLAVGTLAGMAIGWVSGTGWRRRARRAERRVALLEREADAAFENAGPPSSSLPRISGSAGRASNPAKSGD